MPAAKLSVMQRYQMWQAIDQCDETFPTVAEAQDHLEKKLGFEISTVSFQSACKQLGKKLVQRRKKAPVVAHVVLYEQRLNELESTVSAWTDHINATLSVLSRTVAQHNGVIPRVDAVAEMAVRLGDRLSAVEAWAERLNNAEALSERAYSMATELEKAAMSGTPYRIEAVR